MNILYFIYIGLSCIPDNRSTYIITEADICVPKYESKMDGYFFGPCNNTSKNCNETLTRCRFAKHRNNYCLINDSHFCGFRNSGKFKNYYQVECG